MDATQAHQIISALADSCDPMTGEKVEGSVLQHGDVIRALHMAVRALDASDRSKVRTSRARKPANAGKPWTEQEDRALLEKVDEGLSIAELARAHDRTPAGIHARLARHGRVQGQGPQWRGRAANAAASATSGERTQT
jgi:hypothetical protein